MKKKIRKLMILGFVIALFTGGKIVLSKTGKSTESQFFEVSSEPSTSTENEQTLASTSNLKTNDLIKITSEEAKLYQSEDTSSKQLLDINIGELAEHIETVNNFYKITTNDGLTGYLQQEDGQKISTTEQIIPTNLSEATIVLDAGHGGDDTGAISNYGTLFEKDITLETVLTVKRRLETEGATVVLTRNTDTNVTLDEICATSIENKADIFISFHFDSTEHMNEASGTTTYYYYQSYDKLARTINQSLTNWLPLQNRGVEYGNYQILRENTQPSVLLELGYMNNDYDLETFYTTEYQENVANALVEGLTKYFYQQ